MKMEEIKGKRVAIWGEGLEGQSLAAFFAERFPGKEIAFVEGNVIPEGVDVVFKSPGVSAYLPEIAAAKARGVEFSSLINLYLANKPARTKAIGITGTKGKSTTASLLAFMLERLGNSVRLGGNIGVSPLEFIDDPADFAVLELSSFQIADLTEDARVDAALFTNISVAHLDWHRSLENYVADKLRLAGHSNYIAANLADANLRDGLEEGKTVWYNGEGGFHVSGGKAWFGGEALAVPELKIVGEHNLANLCGALAVLEHFGLDWRTALPFLGEFEPLAHRLQKVHEAGGITFVDDSIATVADSVIAALEAFRDKDVALIAGGYDNGSADYARLNQYIDAHAHVKKAVCLPDTGRLIITGKSVGVADMREAVAEALRGLERGVVLLSPAAPSFNMYKNYKERGDDFKKLALQASYL